MSSYTIKSTEINESKREKIITIEIISAEIEKFRGRAIQKMSTGLDLPGFRKGRIPESVIVQKFGEAAILEEEINFWLKDFVPEIIKKEAPDAIALPQISVRKAVPHNPVDLVLNIPLKPNIKLPDYKKLAARINKNKENAPIVEEKEIDEAVTRLRQYAWKAVHPELQNEPKEDELPPLNDQFAEAVGAGKTIVELRERIKKDLQSEKDSKNTERHRLKIMEEILKETSGSIPEVLTLHELDRMHAEFESDIKRMGLTVEVYLKQTNKKMEDLSRDWKSAAEKRALFNIILSEIKKNENIEPDAKEVEHETKHILEHYKETNPENVRSYVEKMLGNQKVFRFLEQIGA